MRDAIVLGHTEIAELMANEETDLSSGTRVDVEYDMCRAAAEGDQVRVRTLVDCGVSVNAVDGPWQVPHSLVNSP
jgi:hypothetical protein